MIDYLTHFYRAGTQPFQSLSSLPDDKAIAIMEALYDEDSWLLNRFKVPLEYLNNRRTTEQWVRQQFILKGGQILVAYPHYMILGDTQWGSQFMKPDDHVLRIPLAEFSEADVSFTYPDSMISYWFANAKPEAWYLPDYHGKVFTMSEILAIVERYGIPEYQWETHLPPDLAPYIEAQVWNHDLLRKYQNQR